MEAILMITYDGEQGTLPEPILYDSTPEQIKAMAAEALATGHVQGIRQITGANLNDFEVRRFDPVGDVGARVVLRPKTAFGF